MKIENEKVIPSLKLANDIANALGVSLYEIFDLTSDESYSFKNCS